MIYYVYMYIYILLYIHVILLPESYDVYTLWVLKQIATEAMESIDFRKMIHPCGTVIFHRKQPGNLSN